MLGVTLTANAEDEDEVALGEAAEATFTNDDTEEDVSESTIVQDGSDIKARIRLTCT